jgi:hypothetical protein
MTGDAKRRFCAGHTHLNFGKQYNHYNLYEAY